MLPRKSFSFCLCTLIIHHHHHHQSLIPPTTWGQLWFLLFHSSTHSMLLQQLALVVSLLSCSCSCVILSPVNHLNDFSLQIVIIITDVYNVFFIPLVLFQVSMTVLICYLSAACRDLANCRHYTCEYHFGHILRVQRQH